MDEPTDARLDDRHPWWDRGARARPGDALARAGYPVIIGSRQAEKAQRVAAELNERPGAPLLQGMDNGGRPPLV